MTKKRQVHSKTVRKIRGVPALQTGEEADKGFHFDFQD